MATEVTMPQMGADVTEGTVVRWLKQVGDEVKRGEVIAEIETDKATVELEAFESGVLRKVVVPEGDTVPVGQVIALLGEGDEAVEEEPERKPRPGVADRTMSAPAGRSAPAEAPAKGPGGGEGAEAPAKEAPAPEGGEAEDEAPAETETVAPAEAAEATARTQPGDKDEEEPPERVPASADARVRVSPVARRIAHDAGLDPATLHGSGPDGRILRRDVEGALRGAKAPPVSPPQLRPHEPAAAARPAAAAAQGGSRVEPLSRMRQAIARRMAQSKQTQPHYYLTLDVDMTDALAFRQQVNAVASEEQRVSINDLIVRACAIALQRHPKFNAAFGEDGLTFHDQVNIDIGIAMDDGLIAPAILDAADKTLGTIAKEAKDLVARAKSGRLTADEYSAGTFTITNLGNFGVETLIGIINPPQAAILGVGSVAPKAVVRDGEVVVRQVMKIALSADHRVSDGAEGARFIKEIQGVLEAPASLAL